MRPYCDDIIQSIMSIAQMPISLEEKRMLLETTKRCFAKGKDEWDIFDSYISAYDELIKKQKEASEAMTRSITGIHCVPC